MQTTMLAQRAQTVLVQNQSRLSSKTFTAAPVSRYGYIHIIYYHRAI